MDPFVAPVPLELNHVQVIVRAMVRVAESDGRHQEELVLIREFYEACRADLNGLADFQDLVKQPFDPAEAREILDTPILKETLLKSCYLVAYADGQLSAQEKAAIAKVVSEVGIDAELASRSEELGRDYLLRQLARTDVASIRKVASEL